MKKNECLISLGLLILLTSCAGIKPTGHYHHSKSSKTPTQQINSFKDETQKISLQRVIQSEAAPTEAREFFLATKNHKKIKVWEKYFTTNGKRSFEIFLKNGQKYRDIIEGIFKKHNLPTDLYYVGLIESGYKNHARSHAGAVGPWQFIKGTASRYGLKVNRYIDERKNIYKSTEAAALYFQDLYNIFGSWELALSAYNAGEYGVIRRIRGANTRDFYELSRRKILPKETRNYVPKIIAAMKVDSMKEKYGIKLTPKKYSKFDHVKSYQVSGKTTVNQLARTLGVSATTIRQYNHDIKSHTIPYIRNKGFEIYLPSKVSYKSKVIKLNNTAQTKEVRKLASTHKSRGPHKFHKVRKNESLFSLSKRYGTTIKTLKKINNLKKSTIFVGQKLKLPQKASSTVYYSYTVKKGDHLTKLAKIFRTNIKKLKNMNRLKKSGLMIGQKIKVPAYTKKYHTVKNGEALYSIARRYRKSLDSIKMLNNLARATIYPGQKVLIELKTL